MDAIPQSTEEMASRGTSIRFEIDADLKQQFQTLCNLKQTNMTDVLTRLIEKEVSDGQDLLKLFAEVNKER
ncbi:MAG: hypothetical protein HC795_13000 [Coleofasciculaceae cyanobacterium RL_1_1]|nr:hypothetical protein [Coleofasciculaceae cyanobacterium RL_1_1]